MVAVRGVRHGSGPGSQLGSIQRVVLVAIVMVVAVMLFSYTTSTGETRQRVFSRFQHAQQSHGTVDMHTHTTDSDGDFTPEEVIEFAHTRGLKSVWITDHDLIRPLERIKTLIAAGDNVGVHVGFGVEITVSWNKKEHHLLGYFPSSSWKNDELSPELQVLQLACARVKESRERRNQAMVAFLNELLQAPEGGIYFQSAEQQAAFAPLTVKEVGEWARIHAALTEVTSLGRPHFRKYLVNKVGVRDDLVFGPRSGSGEGVATSTGVAWDDDAADKEGTRVEALLHSATLAKRDISFAPLPIDEAIRMISDAGGKSVLAHLPTLKHWKKKFLPLLEELADRGLWGVEVFSAEISESDHSTIMGMVEQLGLHATGGSDSHGTLKPYAHLGDVWRSRLAFKKDGLVPSHGADEPEAPYDAAETWRTKGPALSAALRGTPHQSQ